MADTTEVECVVDIVEVVVDKVGLTTGADTVGGVAGVIDVVGFVVGCATDAVGTADTAGTVGCATGTVGTAGAAD